MKRSNRTKQDLASSLKLLMRTSSLPDISVQDIVDSSAISRHTFYYHFIDKQDLVQWVFRSEVIEPMEKEAEGFLNKLIDIMQRMQKEPFFYTRAFEVNGQNSFSEYFFEAMLQISSSSLEEFAQSRDYLLTKKTEDFFSRCITYAVVGMIREWIKAGMKEDPASVMAPFFGSIERFAMIAIEADQETEED